MLTVVQNIAQMQIEQRNQRMMMSNPMSTQYQNLRNIKRATLHKNRLYVNAILLQETSTLLTTKSNGNPMANTSQTNKPNTTGAQIQRDGSQMDMNGQRAPLPNSNEQHSSPNKRPWVEGKSDTDQLGLPLLTLTTKALKTITCPSLESANLLSKP
jgi:hypothetical protein